MSNGSGSNRRSASRPRKLSSSVARCFAASRSAPAFLREVSSPSSFFERSHAGLTPHDKGSHHVRKDHHVPNGHHGELAKIAFIPGFFCLCHAISFHLSPLYRGNGSCANAPDVRGFNQSTSRLMPEEEPAKPRVFSPYIQPANTQRAQPYGLRKN